MCTSTSTAPGCASAHAEAEDWPQVTWKADTNVATRRVNLDTLTQGRGRVLEAGPDLLLNGKMLTGRDAAHKRIADMLEKGEKLPVD